MFTQPPPAVLPRVRVARPRPVGRTGTRPRGPVTSPTVPDRIRNRTVPTGRMRAGGRMPEHAGIGSGGPPGSRASASSSRTRARRFRLHPRPHRRRSRSTPVPATTRRVQGAPTGQGGTGTGEPRPSPSGRRTAPFSTPPCPTGPSPGPSTTRIVGTDTSPRTPEAGVGPRVASCRAGWPARFPVARRDIPLPTNDRTTGLQTPAPVPDTERLDLCDPGRPRPFAHYSSALPPPRGRKEPLTSDSG